MAEAVDEQLRKGCTSECTKPKGTQLNVNKSVAESTTAEVLEQARNSSGKVGSQKTLFVRWFIVRREDTASERPDHECVEQQCVSGKGPATARPKQQVSVVQSAPDPDNLEKIQQVECEYRELQLQCLQQPQHQYKLEVLRLIVNGLLPSVKSKDKVRTS